MPILRVELQYPVVSIDRVFHLSDILVILRKALRLPDLEHSVVVHLENALVVECDDCCCGFDSSVVGILILRPFHP
ncbi:hypothetical protein AR158_C561R [Paramecium bursaria Chlorella virus AR158]|uniref:hypothetical protein n=1 Tax=Paramecium bursaria Chlorella virus AR158 TaxID=380598 RepID=UPI00015AA769|nr:hypothetical protein AR158_C561R [Paramecium bursaria Chlorella virus AR158]ABU44106.1 hypothetical protein AR158_C561R [Paramecium bursaria Chlorella virus AR158]